MDERRLHDDLESLERAAPVTPLPVVRTGGRRRDARWVPAALAMVAGVFIGLWVADVLPREPASPRVAVTPVSSAAVAAGCPVTRPPDPPFVPSKGPKQPADYEKAFWYGSDELWTMPTADGTWRLVPGDDGWYGQKTFWWSVDFAERVPAITVTGRRLDGSAARIRTDTPTNASADFGTAMLVGVELPSPGCWELTATYRDHSVRYVVYVQNPELGPQVAGLRWSSVSFDHDALINELSVVGDRLFTTGRAGSGPAAWYSDDGGDSWSMSTLRYGVRADLRNHQDLALGRVAKFGNLLVSLGTQTAGSSGSDADIKGAIWLSSDNGSTWELSGAEAPLVAEDLAARDDLLVAVGRPPRADAAQIWTSSDAVHWRQAFADQLEHAVFGGVAATTDRFLIVGTRQNDDTTTSAMTWESSDGISWETTAIATPGAFTDVVAGPPALVVAGDVGRGGATFDHAVMPVAQSFNLNEVHSHFAGSATAVASGPLGVVLSVQAVPDKLQGTTWFFPDGRTADAIETDAQVPGFDDLVALPDRFIGLAHCPPTADCFASSFLEVGRPVPPPPPPTEWRTPIPSAALTVPLPTVTDFDGRCRGVGLVDMSLRGDAGDPRVAWLLQPDGTRFEVVWPPGFVARFNPDLEIIDASGSSVLRAGDRIGEACAKIAEPDGTPTMLIVPAS